MLSVPPSQDEPLAAPAAAAPAIPAELVAAYKEIEEEFARYLTAKGPAFDPKGNPHASLDWWRDNEHVFPHVAAMARKWLAVQATSAPSERVFACMRNVAERKRWNLDVSFLASLVFQKMNAHFLTDIDA